MSTDGLEMLAAGLARRARLDALQVDQAPVVTSATQPVARVERGDKRKRRAVTPQITQSSGERTILHKPINTRGIAVDYLNAGDSRIEKLPGFDWSIISAWK